MPTSRRQSSKTRIPVFGRARPAGLTWRAVERSAEDTAGATDVVTASAASSSRGAAHSRAPRTASAARGAAHSFAFATASAARGAAHSFALATPWTAVVPACLPSGTTWATTSFARVPIAAIPSAGSLVFIMGTINLPSVFPLSEASRPGWVQPSRATGTVMTKEVLRPRNDGHRLGRTRRRTHGRHADGDVADEPGPDCPAPFP